MKAFNGGLCGPAFVSVLGRSFLPVSQDWDLHCDLALPQCEEMGHGLSTEGFPSNPRARIFF